MFLAVDDDTDYPESTDELARLLATDDDALAEEILDEAQAVHDRLQERVDGAERRATTLQSSSAVAAGLATAGAGLLLDPGKVSGLGWRLLLGAPYGFTIFCLVMCTWRATLATNRIHRWVSPPTRAIFDRPGQSVAQARTARSAELLRAVGGNERFARYKIAMLRGAAEWIQRALVALLVLAVLVVIYASTVGPTAKSVVPTPSTESTTPLP